MSGAVVFFIKAPEQYFDKKALHSCRFARYAREAHGWLFFYIVDHYK
jgi:hypothetical protein